MKFGAPMSSLRLRFGNIFAHILRIMRWQCIRFPTKNLYKVYRHMPRLEKGDVMCCDFMSSCLKVHYNN